MPVISLKEALNPSTNYRLRKGVYGKILGKLTENSARDQVLSRLFQHILPDQLKDAVLDTRISGTALVIYTPSSAWATRLKYAGPDLLKQIQRLQEFQDLEKVSVVVTPTP
ncbi:MAG: DciA family protein [Gammaproteobacteria bacterium]|nr:DciA family protein [Gammaproteobacteria bacterium]